MMRMAYCASVFAILVCAATAAPFSTSGDGLDIRDGVTVSTITLTEPVVGIESLSISGLFHTYMGDLEFFLRDDTNDILYKVIGQSWCSNQMFADHDYTIVENGATEWYMSGCPPADGTYNQFFGLGSTMAAEDRRSGSSTPLGLISGPAGNWSLVIEDSGAGDEGSFAGWSISGNSDLNCDAGERATCSENAVCTSNGSVVCACKSGFNDDAGDGSVCSDVDECQKEEFATQCDRLAYCQNTVGSWSCVCPEGFVGDGIACSSEAFGIRVVATVPGAHNFTAEELEVLKMQYAAIVSGSVKSANDSFVRSMPVFSGAFAFGSRILDIAGEPDADDQVTLFALYETKAEADADLAALTAPIWAAMGATSIDDGPAVYRWTGGSTSDALEIPASGLSVDSVFFDTSCLETGCWKVDVTYTKGSDDFNVFFIPSASASDSLSYDPIYSAVNPTWMISEADTFFPANHPCSSMDYDPSSGNLPAAITACCIPEFLAMYRPVDAFEAALGGIAGLNLSAGLCGTGERSRGVVRSSVPWFVKAGQDADGVTNFEQPASPSAVHGVFVDGLFAGMATSNIYHTEVVDAYVGVYRARLELDEVELRTSAGLRRGTVGVEHTVDTFVGIVNFSPTGSKVLDTGAVQINLHLEKTSFFSVSTHGTNDYTFLEYVNLRLIAIYNQDDDFSGVAESGDRTVRTDAAAAAHYVQVTFTLGSKYGVNTNSGLVPLDSVRAGAGTFFDEATLDHKCLEWEALAGYSFTDKATFEARLAQSCAPSASMCVSPSAIPDSFVSLNIPLGIDYFAPPAPTLSNNIFVDMVISAVDLEAMGAMTTPNDGQAPWEMKTTLTANIPVVEGGVNIFCDGFTAKTDLKDVANADIVVGSAADATELSRLMIKKDIASTQLAPDAITAINTASIESALMTLVLKGNESYFLSNSGRQEVSIELEDVVSIHIMEDDGDGSDTTAAAAVSALLALPPADNSDLGGLDTDGYALNGAFLFTIDRSAQRAHLEPSSALLTLCPFNPPRPTEGLTPLETCVTRRDVRYREFPWRAGAKSTAMEICVGGSCPSATSSQESAFFVNLLGDSAYARQLAVDYASVIAASYDLNGRYRRAFWINPGYEWTPAQTGGTPIFSVSQKLFLFALITLDEGLASDPGSSLASGPGPTLRRRMLLSSTGDALQDGQSSVGADAFEFETSPSRMLAKVFEVPEDRVATFKVRLQLTPEEVCMAPIDLQASLRTTLDDHLTYAASAFHTAQITTMKIDKADVLCRRRSVRLLLREYSEASAEVTLVVVFKEGSHSVISVAKLATMGGILAFEPISISPKVNTAVDASYVPPPEPASEDADGGEGMPMGLIAGAAAGAVGVVVVVVLAVVMRRRWRRDETGEVLEAVHSINIADLKASLAQEA